MLAFVYILAAIAVLFLDKAIFNPVSYLIWITLFAATILSVGSSRSEHLRGALRDNLIKSCLVGIGLGIVAGLLRSLLVWHPISGLDPGVRYYYVLLENVKNPLGLAALFPLFLCMNFVSSVFYNALLQHELEKQIHWALAILVMSALFGAIHYVTPRPMDFQYGLVAFEGGLIHGIMFRYFKNVLAPTMFLGVQLWIVFVFLSVAGK